MKLLFLFLVFSPLQLDKTQQDCDELIERGVEAMNNNEFTTSLELLTEAKTLAENNAWHRQQFLAINNIGANYYSMLDYGEALNNYLKAYTIAIKELDPNHEMIVLNNIAILYSREYQFDKAEEYFKKAYDIAKENNDLIKIGHYSINLGLVANEQSKFDIAKSYFEEAVSLLQEEDSPLLLQAKMGLAENYFHRDELVLAKELATSLLSTMDDKVSDEIRAFVLLTLSKVFDAEGDLMTAIDYAEQNLVLSLNQETKIKIYQWLAQLYEKNNDFKMSLRAKDSIIVAKDDFNIIKNGRLFETNRVKFEIKNYQNELLNNKEKLISERKTFYTLLLFSLGAIILFTWALYNSYVKNKQRRVLDDRRRDIIALELEKEKSNKLLLEKQIQEQETLRQLEKEKLRNEIDSRNQKLAAKALFLTSRNELIEQIIDSLSRQSEISKNKMLSNQLNQLKSHLKNDTEWESFLKHFEEVNHGFLTSLKEAHPILSSNDLRFISYMYMNLSIKEISLLLNITPVACRKRKERIAKKIGLSESLDLYDYISGV